VCIERFWSNRKKNLTLESSLFGQKHFVGDLLGDFAGGITQFVLLSRDTMTMLLMLDPCSSWWGRTDLLDVT
jgi:hypothetical protein